MLDKVDPKLVAVLTFPAMLVVSLPFAYIGGAFSIIVVDNIVFRGLDNFSTDNTAIGIGVGITIAIIFAIWATYGMYTLSNEVREEAGADAVTV